MISVFTSYRTRLWRNFGFPVEYRSIQLRERKNIFHRILISFFKTQHALSLIDPFSMVYLKSCKSVKLKRFFPTCNLPPLYYPIPQSRHKRFSYPTSRVDFKIHPTFTQIWVGSSSFFFSTNEKNFCSSSFQLSIFWGIIVYIIQSTRVNTRAALTTTFF